MIEHKIFDIKIDEIDYQELLETIENTIISKTKIKICYTNPHIVRLSEKEKNLKNVLNDFDINHIDGTGLTIALKVLHKKNVPRFNWTDHSLKFLYDCENKGWSIFFLGSDQNTISNAVEKVKEKFPRLKFAGFLNGFSNLNDETGSIIKKSSPDILRVGLGSPKQELWVVRNFQNLNCSVTQCVGDVFSHLAGKRLRGPKIFRQTGFEWYFRLLQHPIRFFDRYVIGIPIFIYLMVKHKLKVLTKK